MTTQNKKILLGVGERYWKPNGEEFFLTRHTLDEWVFALQEKYIALGLSTEYIKKALEPYRKARKVSESE